MGNFFGLEKLIDMKKTKLNKIIYNILFYVIGYILLMQTVRSLVIQLKHDYIQKIQNI